MGTVKKFLAWIVVLMAKVHLTFLNLLRLKAGRSRLSLDLNRTIFETKSRRILEVRLSKTFESKCADSYSCGVCDSIG